MAKILHVLEIFVLWNVLPNVVEPSMNLALHKTTLQSSNWNQNLYLSEKAVDGIRNQKLDSGSCTHTNIKQQSAWWWVDLGNTFDIKRIKIFYRKEAGDNTEHFKRFNGYSIHIDSQLCYEDPVDVLPSALTVQHNCSFQGRYVNMSIQSNPQASNPIITLCEFEVYGCFVGLYGENNCNTPCSNGCESSKCDPDNGSCKCIVGWRGDKCTEPACPSGQYGNPCKSCPSGCLNGKCDATSGQCTDGCTPGLHGLQCDEACPGNCAGGTCQQGDGDCFNCKAGYYWTGCNLVCSTRCKDAVCHKINGHCKYGCDGPYTGDTCAECRSGYYGTTSCQPCPSGCNIENYCNPNNGNCISGCKSTLYGQHCDLNCSANCGTQSCDRNSGNCTGCKAGFHGSLCNLACSANCINKICQQYTGTCSGCNDGFYGDNCLSKCSTGCKTDKCYQYSGNCEDGCINALFTNNQCTECVTGKHGEHCSKSCPATCKGNVCHRNNNTCVNGCAHQNMTGVACDGCKTGLHGENCTIACPDYCANSTCNKTTGNCVSCKGKFSGLTCSECKHAYHGSLCDKQCPGNCQSDICRQNNGTCVGCIAGFHGEYCDKSCSCSAKGCRQNNGNCIESAPVTSSSIAGPAGGATGGVIVVIVIIVLIIIFVRRKQARNPKGGSRYETEKSSKSHSLTAMNHPKHIGRNEYMNASAVEARGKQDDDEDDETPINGEGYHNTQDIYMNAVSREVPVSELSQLISRKAKENKFEEEYNHLPKGYRLPHEIGKKQENLIKNRFKTTFPYDHSRVVLEKVHGHSHSDYINANYIDGTEQRKLYIATQGPKPNTLSDFWTMVWQEKVGKIVMLTNLIENSKVKCDQYWPDYGESKDVVQMRITSESEREYAYFILRSLLLHNKKTNESRHVKQFHFTMWPDHGTPDPVQLMLFHRKIKDAETELTGPCVVHCAIHVTGVSTEPGGAYSSGVPGLTSILQVHVLLNFAILTSQGFTLREYRFGIVVLELPRAGIGRTGTFIALDTLHEYGERTEKIDIFEYVRRMRDCRMNMIQTVEQYIVLHEALLESFQYIGRAMTKEQFFEACNELQNGKPKNQTHIYKEYQNLTSLRPVYGIEYYEGAMSNENKRKSRNQSVLAVDKYRPYLTSHHSSRTDFINAVMLPSCTKRCGYIATHYPLKDTIEDLWCMIYDHDCKAVAVLDESGDKDQSSHWYPSVKGEMSTQSFVITKVAGPASYNHVKRIDFNVKHKRRDEEKEVAIFILRPWPTKQCSPPSTPDLLQLIDRVDNCQKSGHGPATVICSDGAQCNGIVCAVSNVIQNLKLDNEIDIFHTVRQLQIRRPQFFLNFEEYEACYNIIKTYLESTNVYANA